MACRAIAPGLWCSPWVRTFGDGEVMAISMATLCPANFPNLKSCVLGWSQAVSVFSCGAGLGAGHVPPQGQTTAPLTHWLGWSRPCPSPPLGQAMPPVHLQAQVMSLSPSPLSVGLGEALSLAMRQDSGQATLILPPCSYLVPAALLLDFGLELPSGSWLDQALPFWPTTEKGWAPLF